MKQEDKELLIKDLCARIPYDTIVKTPESDEVYLRSCDTFGDCVEVADYNKNLWHTEDIKPYLRSMSSVTDEEKTTIARIATYASIINITDEMLEFCCSRHIDWRGLIEKGLALEAKEGMYKL